MIEKRIRDYLEDKLDIPVRMEEEESLIGRYIIVEKTGGSERDHLASANLTIQSYAPTLYEAAELNEIVKNKMENIIELDDISKCELNSDYNYTDTKRKKYRYQAVYDIIYF